MNFSDRVYELIGNPLEWSSSRKACLILWLFLCEQFMYYATARVIASSETYHIYLNPEGVAKHTLIYSWLMLLTIVVIVAIYAARVRRPHHVAYEYIATTFFGVVHVYYGYTIGLMSLPIGVVLAGGPVVGFIFFDRKAVTCAFVLSMALLVGLSLASVNQSIPYAPIAANIFAENGNVSSFWSLLYFYFAMPHLISIFGLAFYLLQRWREREQEIRELSITDSLTGLMNRRSILGHLNLEQDKCDKHGHPLAVLMVDLDHFKQINDTWGHGVGDDVLKLAASALKETVRNTDFVGRYGGEEFLVVLPGLDQEHAKRLSERIREAIADIEYCVESGNQQLSITASLGLCCCSERNKISASDLIRLADMALYRAKDTGRDRLEVAA